jgi:hypothetical protein
MRVVITGIKLLEHFLGNISRFQRDHEFQGLTGRREMVKQRTRDDEIASTDSRDLVGQQSDRLRECVCREGRRF